MQELLTLLILLFLLIQVKLFQKYSLDVQNIMQNTI